MLVTYAPNIRGRKKVYECERNHVRTWIYIVANTHFIFLITQSLLECEPMYLRQMFMSILELEKRREEKNKITNFYMIKK